MSLIALNKDIHMLWAGSAAIFAWMLPLTGSCFDIVESHEVGDIGYWACSSTIFAHGVYNYYLINKNTSYKDIVIANILSINLLGLLDYSIKQKYATQQTTLSIFPTTDGAGIQFAYKF